MNVNLAEALASMIGCDADKPNYQDYVGEDGLVYCHVCHKKKQTRLSFEVFGLPDKIVPCACKCQKDKWEEEERRKKAAKDFELISKLKKASLMSGKYADSDFSKCKDNGHNSKAINAAKRYVEKFSLMLEKNQGLLFYGTPGTGKTYLAACIANELIQRKTPVLMTSFVKLLSQMSNFGDDKESIINRMNAADLLIIDDLGAERSTDTALEQVYNIIDSRYRERKPMILTTNLTLGAMQQVQDIRYSRIYDRIFEVCYPIEFTGPSWRYAEAAERYEEMKSMFD